MKMTSSILLNIVLVAFLVSSVLFMNTTADRSNYETRLLEEYDPHLDYDMDGDIDLFDAVYLLKRYGMKGTPVNWTELSEDINELRDRVDSLNASVIELLSRALLVDTRVEALETRCRIIPNGDFEKGIVGMEYGDIINWNYSLTIMYAPYGNPPIGEAFYINNTHYYNRFQSLYMYLKTKSVFHPDHPMSGHDSGGNQYLSTEQPVFTTADYITLWVEGYGYTTSSRYDNYITLILTDGNETYYEKLRNDRWDGLHVNYYDETEIGNDGNTWYRYTRQIPEYLDKSNLTVKIQHNQRAWDFTTASSWFYLDAVYFSDANGNPVP